MLLWYLVAIIRLQHSAAVLLEIWAKCSKVAACISHRVTAARTPESGIFGHTTRLLIWVTGTAANALVAFYPTVYSRCTKPGKSTKRWRRITRHIFQPQNSFSQGFFEMPCTIENHVMKEASTKGTGSIEVCALWTNAWYELKTPNTRALLAANSQVLKPICW